MDPWERAMLHDFRMREVLPVKSSDHWLRLQVEMVRCVMVAFGEIRFGVWVFGAGLRAGLAWLACLSSQPLINNRATQANGERRTR